MYDQELLADIVLMISSSKDVMSSDKVYSIFINKNSDKSIHDIIVGGFPDELVSNIKAMYTDTDSTENMNSLYELTNAIKSLPTEKRRGVRLV